MHGTFAVIISQYPLKESVLMRAYIFSQFYVGLSRCPKEYLYQSFFTLGYKNHTALSVVEIKSKGIKGRYFQRIMDERRARFHLLIHKYYCIPDAKRGYYGFIIVVVRVRVRALVRVRRDFLLATYSPHFFPDFFHIWQVT